MGQVSDVLKELSELVASNRRGGGHGQLWPAALSFELQATMARSPKQPPKGNLDLLAVKNIIVVLARKGVCMPKKRRGRPATDNHKTSG